MHISEAANTHVPAFLTLVTRGYSIRRGKIGTHDWWTAERGADLYGAYDVLTLLGLTVVGETRGENWRASDEEIDSFFSKYPDPS